MAISDLKITQFRHYGFQNEKNSPNDESIWEKNLFEGYNGIIKIGIQTLPGVEFSLNQSTNNNKIIIDHTGVFELDLSKTNAVISTLRFTPESMIRIDEVDNANIIVDILYSSYSEAVNEQ